MTSSAPPSLAERFASALDRVVRVVGDRFRSWCSGPQPGPIQEPLGVVVQNWLARRRRLVLALIARFQAGKLRKPRPLQVRTGPEGATPPGRGRVPPRTLLPRGRNWLGRLAPEVGPSGEWLSDLLSDPEMRELAAASPDLGRYLRPVLRAIGREVPEWLKAPRRPRPPEDDFSDIPPMDKRYGTPKQWRRRARKLEALDNARMAPPAPAQPPSPPPPSPPTRPLRPAIYWINVDLSR
jgi:hypothetical protein